MKTEIPHSEVVDKKLVNMQTIDNFRNVLFFDDDTYFITPGHKNIPLDDELKLKLGIMTLKEHKTLVETLDRDSAELVAHMRQFRERHPLDNMYDLLDGLFT